MKFDLNLVIIAAIGVMTIVNFVLLIVNNFKVKKFKKLYEKALAKFNSSKNVKDEFQTIYDRLNEVESISRDTVNTVNKFEEKMKNNLQKIGFVKYNAYDDTDNKLSFALALLDENENGILINHIYSKHGSNFYAKLVNAGKVEERISEEEASDLKLASEDKDFKERRVTEIKKTSKNRKK